MLALGDGVFCTITGLNFFGALPFGARLVSDLPRP